MSAEPVAPAFLAAGWLGQACFFARFFVQWLASERARRSVVPGSFWWLSLAGSVLVSFYAVARGTPIFLFGFVVGGAIAVRNLTVGRGDRRLAPRWGAALAVVLVGALIGLELADERLAREGSRAWLAIGALGQSLWVARFPLQWFLSERAGRSHFPLSFWRLSLAGNVLLLAYALHLRDPVFVLGFLPGPLLQVRNLVLARRAPGPA